MGIEEANAVRAGRHQSVKTACFPAPLGQDQGLNPTSTLTLSSGLSLTLGADACEL